MRLLQVSLRTLLIYSLILVLVSVPVSVLSIRGILMKDTDALLAIHKEEFVRHIKGYEYLADLEMDLGVWDQLSYDVAIARTTSGPVADRYETIHEYDSAKREDRVFRALSSYLVIKGKPYNLTIRMSLADNDEILLAVGIVQAVVITLLATGLLLLNRALQKKLWKPFYDILGQLKAYQVDKTGAIPVVKSNIVEFDDLSETVSHLAERNRKAFLHQKEFIEDASHELQTPLAIFHSKLDNLMQHAGLSERDASTLAELEQAVRRMSRLNKNLLLLSKIDNEQFSERQEVDVAQLAQSSLENVKVMVAEAAIAVEARIAPCRVWVNATLMEVLLTNVFHNALRHTPSGGHVVIDLEENFLKVSNSGVPLRTSPHRIFDRFTKEGNSERNTGLGLAIVRRVCEVSGFQVDYNYERDMHVFTVRFR